MTKGARQVEIIKQRAGECGYSDEKIFLNEILEKGIQMVYNSKEEKNLMSLGIKERKKRLQ